jgi:hypothetical protein
MILPPYDRTGFHAPDCGCEFDHDPEDAASAPGYEPWQYQRTCEFCGNNQWWTNSCPHEKARTCWVCDRVMEVVLDFHPVPA